MVTTKLRALLLIACLALSACVLNLDYPYGESEQIRNRALLLGSPGTEDPLDILAIDDELKSHLTDRIPENWTDTRKLSTLRRILFSDTELDIRYESLNTRTALETFRSRRGNCLSMTNLFIASARHVGLDAHYQKVSVRPTWDNYGNTMVRYEHIVAVGTLASGETYVVDFLPEFLFQERNSEQLTDGEALALFHNNLGAEGIVDGDYGHASRQLRLALSVDSEFPDAWNNLGALMSRQAQYDLAEFAYRTALRGDPRNTSALSNLAELLEVQGRSDEAVLFKKRVNRYRARNPYFHYFLAIYYFQKEDFEAARGALQKAIMLKEDEPDFYLVLAKTHHRLGNSQLSEEMILAARQLSEGKLDAPPLENSHRFWTED